MAIENLASYIDHTILAPAATESDVAKHCSEGESLEVAAVCVSPSMVGAAFEAVGERVRIAAVAGFPSGAHPTSAKIADAVWAVEQGASEIDMVINLGLAIQGDWDSVQQDIAGVRQAVPAPVVLKVIIESAALDTAQIVAACEASERAGADFVKTSTGFHPAGGASLDAVALMAKTVGGRLGVKASGGIRTGADAEKMIEAGATRIGASSGKAILGL